MSDPLPAARHAEALAWCKAREDELRGDMLAVSGPFRSLPSLRYGEVCQQALDFAVEFGAADLVPHLGPTDFWANASMGEALRQVQLLVARLAGAGPSRPRPAPPQLSVDAEDLAILRALAVRPTYRLTVDQIASLTRPRVSRKTVVARMQSLLDGGLVEEPRGKKGGRAITDAGLKLLEEYREG
jgi:hypothetical protein